MTEELELKEFNLEIPDVPENPRRKNSSTGESSSSVVSESESEFDDSPTKVKDKSNWFLKCLRLGLYGSQIDESEIEDSFVEEGETDNGIGNLFGLCGERNITNACGFCPRRNFSNCFGLMRSSKQRKRKGMGMVLGVIIPCVLNIFGVILFLRLPMGIGNAGILLAMVIFTLGYIVTGVTVTSICAISTNGTVKGGGAYYMISRVLGPELGGGIGFIFFFANVAGGALYIIGFIDSFTNVLPVVGNYFGGDEYWTKVLNCTITLVFLTIICLIGADCFGRIGCCIFMFLAISLIATIISFSLIETPLFGDMYNELKHHGYTGWRLHTFTENIMPYSEDQPSMDDIVDDVVKHCTYVDHFNRTNKDEYPEVGYWEGCNITIPEHMGSGSYYIDVETNKRLNFMILFGILFPACTGAMAGANLSGDLANPSWAIPTGTIFAVVGTYLIYIFLIVMFGATTSREALITNYNITSDVSFLPILVSVGIFAATLSSGLTSIIGGSRILSALAKDNIAPFMGWCGLDMGWPKKEPRLAVIVTAVLTQFLVFMPSIGYVAPFVTQFFLVAYGFVNFACFALAITSAPNFRPTYRYYSWMVSLFGCIICIILMFLIDWIPAIGTLVACVVVIGVISCYVKPKPWGDIVTAFLYYLGKKFQVRIHTKSVDETHVKYWRLKALALIGHPPHHFRLIRILDDLSRPKGGLCILGSVKTGDYREKLAEYKKDREAFLLLMKQAKLRVFYEITFAKKIRQGIQNLLLNAGFGGMDPDIVFIPLYETIDDVAYGSGLVRQKSLDVINTPPQLEEKKGGKVLTSLTKFSNISKSLKRERKKRKKKMKRLIFERSGPEPIESENPSVVYEMQNLAAHEDLSSGYESFTISEYMNSLVDILLLKKGLVITTGLKSLDRSLCKPSSLFYRFIQKKMFSVDLWIIHSLGNKNEDYGDIPSSSSDLEDEEGEILDEIASKDEHDPLSGSQYAINEELFSGHKKEFLSPHNQRSLSLMFQLASLLLQTSIWKKYHYIRVLVVVDESSDEDIENVRDEVSYLLKLCRVDSKKVEIVRVNLNMVSEFLDAEKDLDEAFAGIDRRRRDLGEGISPVVDFDEIDPEKLRSSNSIQVTKEDIENLIINEGDDSDSDSDDEDEEEDEDEDDGEEIQIIIGGSSSSEVEVEVEEDKSSSSEVEVEVEEDKEEDAEKKKRSQDEEEEEGGEEVNEESGSEDSSEDTEEENEEKEEDEEDEDEEDDNDEEEKGKKSSEFTLTIPKSLEKAMEAMKKRQEDQKNRKMKMSGRLSRGDMDVKRSKTEEIVSTSKSTSSQDQGNDLLKVKKGHKRTVSTGGRTGSSQTQHLGLPRAHTFHLGGKTDVRPSKTFSSFASLRKEIKDRRAKKKQELKLEFNLKRQKSYISVDLGKGKRSHLELFTVNEDMPEFRIGGKILSEMQQMTFLNRIIRKNTHENSSLVFVTLPPPPVNFETIEAHETYYQMLRALTDRLPPTLLVYSSQNVISTAI